MRIALIGDIALNGLFVSDKLNNSKRLVSISKKLRDCDLVFANLETPLKGEGVANFFKLEKNGVLLHTAEDVLIEALKLLNISCVSIGNNHILDFGINGLKKTIELLNNLGVKSAGAGITEEIREPATFHIKGKNIAFFSYVDIKTNPHIISSWQKFLNIFILKDALNSIKDYRDKGYLIIVSIHWGLDYSRFYSKEQKIVAQSLIDAGAGVVMGHHPHTYQPYVIYNTGLIFYSLGSLCFGDFIRNGKLQSLKRKTKTSFIPIINDNLKILELVPTRELKGNYIKINDKSFLNFKRKIAFLATINRISFKLRILNWILILKESLIDRIYEFFFGYYRKPLKDLIQLKTYKKISYITRDIKKMNDVTK